MIRCLNPEFQNRISKQQNSTKQVCSNINSHDYLNIWWDYTEDDINPKRYLVIRFI